MRLAWVCLLTACGGGSGGRSMDVSTSFPVTQFSGNGPSPLDPLNGQTIDISVHWDQTDYNNGDGSAPQGCKPLTIGYGFGVTTRTAHGATAQLVQSQILDRLDNWDVAFQLCDAAGASSVTLESTINELNLSFGCFGVPATAMKKNAQGFPELTSFTATQCSATILDVSNNRVLGNDNFSMQIATSPAQLP
ncbi:MAG: hypothetical protein JO257_05205 [Deltaproteobacteria bacterium]|nr:hypothetical protein [Deltaproteobacteria bacterium]